MKDNKKELLEILEILKKELDFNYDFIKNYNQNASTDRGIEHIIELGKKLEDIYNNQFINK